MTASTEAVLNSASRLLISLCVLGLAACWGSPEKNIRERLDQLAQQVRLLQDNAAPGDAEAEALIEKAHEQIADVSNCLVESDYDKARKILDDLSDQLTAYAKITDQRLKADLRIFGPATSYRSVGNDSYRELTGREDVELITALKTGLRSLVALKLTPEISLEVQNESEVRIERKGAALEIHLDFGTIRVISENGASPLKLIQGKLTAQVNGLADLELARNEITGSGYLTNYGHDLSWEVEGHRGILKNDQGLSWLGRYPEIVTLNPPPRIEMPNNQSTYHADSGDTTRVEFRWYTQMTNDAFQLQVSDHHQFATRVFDNHLEQTHTDLTLAVGTYHWRIRGTTKDKAGQMIPGPYTKTMMVYVSLSGLPAVTAPTTEKAAAPPPEVENFKIETIGTSVIVTGRTNPTMRVKANGTSAILDEDGEFRAIIDLEPGVQTIRLEISDPKTGTDSIIEKKVKI